ncbi:hypothetical protein X756_26310 [Mesorhizobium sp. LSHC412B00]|nr:hypothetical protein X756_26310 [Mesorhizobium sp. LSHC412B00]
MSVLAFTGVVLMSWLSESAMRLEPEPASSMRMMSGECSRREFFTALMRSG